MTARYGARGPSGRVWCPGPTDSAGESLTPAAAADVVRQLVIDGGLDLMRSVDGGPWQPADVTELDAVPVA